MTLDQFALNHPDAMVWLSIPLMLATLIGVPVALCWLGAMALGIQ